VLVGEMLSSIREGLMWSQGDPDMAYQLSDSSDDVNWITYWRDAWRRWRDLSNERLTGSAYVVFTDISCCYESVDLQRLSSELRSLGCGDEAVSALSSCLNRWAVPRGRGIPQGYSASDILGKVYLSTVDARLRADGFNHLRYVDDIRIFCSRYGEALRAVQRLTEILSGCGLTIQSAKTRILQAATLDARAKIDGVAPTIEGVQNALLEGIGDATYGTVAQLEEIASATPDTPCTEILERTWAEQITSDVVCSVGKTLLRYLLNRLAATGSRVALELVPQIIRERAEELETCLRYLGRCGRDSDIIGELPDLVNHDAFMYDRSLFLVLRWLWTDQICADGLLAFARLVAADRNWRPWTRAYAKAIIGRWGTRSDLDMLVDLYSDARDEIERSEIVCCTARMEISRRNAFLSRVAGECMWTRWASEAIRSGALNALMTPTDVL
jgi:hypothetical protein